MFHRFSNAKREENRLHVKRLFLHVFRQTGPCFHAKRLLHICRKITSCLLQAKHCKRFVVQIGENQAWKSLEKDTSHGHALKT